MGTRAAAALPGGTGNFPAAHPSAQHELFGSQTGGKGSWGPYKASTVYVPAGCVISTSGRPSVESYNTGVTSYAAKVVWAAAAVFVVIGERIHLV